MHRQQVKKTYHLQTKVADDKSQLLSDAILCIVTRSSSCQENTCYSFITLLYNAVAEYTDLIYSTAVHTFTHEKFLQNCFKYNNVDVASFSCFQILHAL